MDVYNSRYGVFNYLFKSLGIIDQNINWLGGMRFKWHHFIPFTTSVGQPIVLYVSALGNVDHSLVEAAQVDGANRRQVFGRSNGRRSCPPRLLLLIITTINSFQCRADPASAHRWRG